MRIMKTAFLLAALCLLAMACANGTTSEDPELTPFTSDSHTIALWHLDDGAGQVAADSSGHGYDLYLGSDSTAETADPAWSTEGRLGGCLDFNGANSQYAYRGLASPIPLSTDNQVSVELWYRTTTTSGVVFWAGFINCMVGWTGSPSFYFSVGDGSNWQNCYLATAANSSIADGDWHYIAATFDGSTLILYLDGDEIGRASQTTTLANPSTLYLGGRPANTFVTGQIDEVRISDTARTASEISSYFSGS